MDQRYHYKMGNETSKKSIRGPGNPNWGGARKESKLIEKYADEWCKDNGYPLIKRKYVYKGAWKLVNIKR